MRSRDVQNEMIDDFEPTAGLKLGPDGMQGMPDRTDLPPEPPRLCLAGPCRHYHRMVIQLDAQQPGPSVDADGTIRANPRVFHPETHHYCYPDVGIETNLGAHPVLECNRWIPVSRLSRVPIVGETLARREARQIRLDYDRKLGRFHRQRESEAAAYVPPEHIDLVVSVHLPVRKAPGNAPRNTFRRRMEFRPGDPLSFVLLKAMEASEIPLRGETPVCLISGDLIDNLDATISDLGLVDMTDVVFDFTATPQEKNT